VTAFIRIVDGWFFGTTGKVTVQLGFYLAFKDRAVLDKPRERGSTPVFQFFSPVHGAWKQITLSLWFLKICFGISFARYRPALKDRAIPSEAP
jgi:hypothetical protein